MPSLRNLMSQAIAMGHSVMPISTHKGIVRVDGKAMYKRQLAKLVADQPNKPHQMSHNPYTSRRPVSAGLDDIAPPDDGKGGN